MELWDKQPTDLYFANLLASEQIVVNQGGTSSGKSYALMQVLLSLAVCNPNWTITVAGSTIPKLKEDVMRITAELVFTNKTLAGLIKSYNVQDRIYTFKSGSLIEFKSYDTLEEAKGGKRHVLYMNEATRFQYDVFFELAIRTTVRTFIDYNPTTRFWVHDILLGNPDQYPSVKVIRSWHEHNPYLSEDMHRKIESISDKELWKVYARGLTGKLTGLVFDWGIVDKFPTNDISEIIWGIDWGYTSDPTAITKTACMLDGSFVTEVVFYAPMSSIMKDDNGDEKIAEVDYLVYVMKQAGWDGEPIYADHDKELIIRFRQRGVMVLAAEKGVGAELNRILYCKQKTIRYTAQSKVLSNELGRYRFVDNDGNNSNKVSKGNDHAIDSCVMAIYSHRNRALVK